jgi:hypothetical protein
MEFIDYLHRCIDYAAAHPSQRRGQAYMNVLREVRPDLYKAITATLADAFYRDELIEAMLTWVGAHWDLDNAEQGR